MKWIITNFRMLLLAAGLSFVTGLGGLAIGFVKGQASIEAKQNRQAIVDVKTGQNVELIIQRKPKNEVQKLLEQKWCRDCQ